MPRTLRQVLAVVAGLVPGRVANGFPIVASGQLIPPPAGA